MSQPVEISGAGPSGLAAALTLAKAGARVCVYERHADVGSRFHGDFQGLENWTTEQDVLEELREIGIEPTFRYRPFSRGVVLGPDYKPRISRSRRPILYLVQRGPEAGSLDWALKQQALSAGVEIRFETPAGPLPNGGIVAEGPRGADALAIGYLFETDHADGLWGIFCEELAPKGYAYLLIWNGRATLATFIFAEFDHARQHLKRCVEFVRSVVGLDIRNARPFGGIGSLGLPRTARYGDLLFVGEAAGFQDTLWGFGMRYAMLSGHLAARAWLDGDLGRYDQLWKRRFGGLLKSALVNRLLYNMAGNRGYGSLVRALSRPDDVQAWLNTHYRSKLWKTMVSPLARGWVRLRSKGLRIDTGRHNGLRIDSPSRHTVALTSTSV